MSLFNRIRWFKSPKYNIYVSRNIRIYALQWMLLYKEEINTFCFTNGMCLFPNDLHGNYIICTVECTFSLQWMYKVWKLSTYYLQRYSSFCEFYFSLCEIMTSYAIIYICQKRLSYLFRNYNLLKIEIG